MMILDGVFSVGITHSNDPRVIDESARFFARYMARVQQRGIKRKTRAPLLRFEFEWREPYNHLLGRVEMTGITFPLRIFWKIIHTRISHAIP